MKMRIKYNNLQGRYVDLINDDVDFAHFNPAAYLDKIEEYAKAFLKRRFSAENVVLDNFFLVKQGKKTVKYCIRMGMSFDIPKKGKKEFTSDFDILVRF